MAKIFVGIGSNTNPAFYLGRAFNALNANYKNLKLSPVYQCRSVGFDGDDFINLVASFESPQSLTEVQQAMKAIEFENGRTGEEPKWSGRTLDIDILTFDNWVGEFRGIKLPRDEILSAAHVLKPLADLAPQQLHPVLKKCYADLWRTFSGDSALKPLTLCWGDYTGESYQANNNSG